ncbi:MAG TPA: AraC family transcriptional regulator [Steroidobacteraceae bacterium]|nr:AraC family transcriptional regulator [Steroidobacteraceae bacterium]
MHAVLRAYERYGEDPGNALRSAGISSSDLQRPDGRVTASQMEIFAHLAMRQLDDEALGWFSRKLPWGSYGMLCRASLSGANLGVALKRWCRHHRLLTDDIVLELASAGPETRLTISENRRLGEMRELCLFTSLRYVYGFACWLVETNIPLVRVEFPFQAPRHTAVYASLFPGPTYFGAPRAAMVFETECLTLPLRRDEHELRNMLSRALAITVRPYRSERLLVPRLRKALRARGAELRTGELLAAALNVSLRTLHRQLQNEGTSLQELKNEIRRDLAIERLQRTSRSLKQIAREIGFQSEKSFIRAFRQWTDCSPMSFRR